MRSRFLIFLTGLLLILSSGSLALAQSAVPVVGFVEARDLGAALTGDEGADGVSRLASVFRSFGAQTRVISLSQNIPGDVSVVVIVGPRRALTVPELARLWLHIARGNHLLIALDPNGYQGINSERRRGGFDALFSLEYGLALQDGLLVEPWMSAASLARLVDSWSLAEADSFVSHPVTAPLLTYDMPVWYWGGRSVEVDAIGPFSRAYPLLVTENAYGETNAASFRATNPDPLVVNIGVDPQGRLLLGGLSESLRSGSRVALLGDSGIVQNIYGLTRLESNTALPRFPGNEVLVTRLVAWLLGIPEDLWPILPEGYTWIALDGQPNEWSQATVSGSTTGTLIRQVHATHNDSYLYMMLQTTTPPPPETLMTLTLTVNNQTFSIFFEDGVANASPGGGISQRIEDAAVTVGSVIELRLPLRVVGASPVISRLCVSFAPLSTDCADNVVSLASPLRDPVPLRLPPGPTAVVRTTGTINIRALPTQNSTSLGLLENRTPFAAIGRNAAGDWIQVRNARYEGWIATRLLGVNAEVTSLVIVEP